MILVCIGMVVGAMIMCGGLFVGGLCMSSRHSEDHSSNLTAGMSGGVLTDSRAEKLINEVMCEFNFERVHKVMCALGWKWYTISGLHTPSADEIRQHARGLLQEAIEVRGFVNIGGFEARYFEENGEACLKLQFIAAEWEADV